MRGASTIAVKTCVTTTKIVTTATIAAATFTVTTATVPTFTVASTSVTVAVRQSFSNQHTADESGHRTSTTIIVYDSRVAALLATGTVLATRATLRRITHCNLLLLLELELLLPLLLLDAIVAASACAAHEEQREGSD